MNAYLYLAYNYHSDEQIIQIALDKKEFFPGQTVSGRLLLNLAMPLTLFDIVIRLELIRLSNSLLNRQLVVLLEQRLNLPAKFNLNNSQIITLPPSSYNFPFSFTLAKDLMPSFEFIAKDKLFSSTYTFSAHISSSIGYPISSVNLLIRSRLKHLADPLFQSSCVNVQAWGVKDQGTTILSLSYPKNNYKYLDTVPLSLTLDNTRGKLGTEYVKIEFHRNVQVDQLELIDTVLFKHEYPLVCRSNQVVKQKIDIKIEDNELSNMHFNQNSKDLFLVSYDEMFFSCRYYIKATCYFSSFVTFSSRPRVILPLSITHQLNDDAIDANIAQRNEVAIQEAKAKEVSEMEEAIKQSEVEFEKKKQRDIEEEMYIDEQIKRIENESKVNGCNERMLGEEYDYGLYKHNEVNHNLFAKNEVPLVNVNQNEGENYFDYFARKSTINKGNENGQNQLKMNQKEFSHNMSIFNQEGRFDEKILPQQKEKQKEEVIDINAL